MRSAGITVKPIVMLDGVRHVNQVFFDAVKVPVANRVGAEGDGWTLAKFLLSHERAFIDRHQSRVLMLQHIRKAVARMTQSAIPAADLDSLLMRLVEAEARMISLSALEQKYIDAWEGGHDAALGPSVLKVRGTAQLQEMAELWRDLQGPYATCYDVRNVETGSGLFSSEPWVAAAPVNYLYLFSRCHTIFGGSNEIQRNIIARQLLAS
jgi:alkylation response protein AidB-like acyl-CoA dehydrogenase